MPDEKVSLNKKPIVIQVHGWYPIVVVSLVMILLTVGNIVFTFTVDDKRAEAERKARVEADRRWCALMVELDNAYQSGPTQPTTEIGRRVAAAISALRASLGCVEVR